MLRTTLIGSLLTAGLLAASCGGGSGVNERAVRKLMEEKLCLTCHTLNGRDTLNNGTKAVGPTLKGVFGKTEHVLVNGEEKEIVIDEAYLRESITNPSAKITKGYKDEMAPKEVSPEEVTQIVEYLKTLK